MKKYMYASPLAISSLLVSLTLLSNCKDNVLVDLESKSVRINTPDSILTNSKTLTLYWEAVKGAYNYRVQIVSPSFALSANLLTDTVIKSTKLILQNVPEGEYEWRVRAENTNNSPYSYARFTVDCTPPFLSYVTQPVNGYAGNSPVVFHFQRDPQCSKDSLYIYTDTLAATLYTRTVTADTTWSFSAAAGIYFWKIISLDKAGNKATQAYYSTFTIN